MIYKLLIFFLLYFLPFLKKGYDIEIYFISCVLL